MFIALIFLQIFFTFTSGIIGRSDEVNKQIVESLIIGINSQNLGLRTSSAYMLGELKLNEGVIPLLKMLKSDNSEDVRIIAALSLLKIGDSRGIFAIKQAIKFDESKRVRRLCYNFYGKISDIRLESNLTSAE